MIVAQLSLAASNCKDNQFLKKSQQKFLEPTLYLESFNLLF